MNSLKQSRKAAIEGLPRRKLYSLRFLNPKYQQAQSARHDPEVFLKLERSLARDNNEQQPIAEASPVFPDQEKQVNNQTLWQTFLQQALKVQDKVQSQRVNCYERQYNRFKKQVERQISNCKFQLERIENLTKQKYKQIHSHYEEIRFEKVDVSIKSPLAKTKQNRKSEPSLITQNNPKIIVLRETIQSLKKEIESLEHQANALKAKQTQIKMQWLCLLKKMLREGYYLRRGVIPILEQMAVIKYVPVLGDLPNCLDDVSKKCLLLEYQQLRSNVHKIDSEPATTRISSEPKSRIMGITDKQLTRDIYKETKQMMFSLIRETANKQQFTLPPILPAKVYQDRPAKNDWRINEKRRLSHVYQGQKYSLSKSILFGPKVQIF